MGRVHTTNHCNRDCREAVQLALFLARQWGQDLYVLFGHKVMRYVIHERPAYQADAGDGKRRICVQNCYRVNPAGKVMAYPGYPPVDEMLGSAGEEA